jgi:hypothetical protein
MRQRFEPLTTSLALALISSGRTLWKWPASTKANALPECLAKQVTALPLVIGSCNFQ